MAGELARPDSDPAPFLNEAKLLAREQNLDLLEIIGRDGAIISSAQYPARFGYKKDWVVEPVDWRAAGAFVELEKLPEETAVALLAVRPAPGPGGSIYLVGGQRIDKEMLDSLPLPASMHARLYRSLGSARRGAVDALGVDALVERVRESGHVASLSHGGVLDAATTTYGIPLSGRSRQLLAVLLLEARHGELFWLTWFIRSVGFLGALAGIAVGGAVAWWAASRVTRPVSALVDGAGRVAAGDWTARVEAPGNDELSQLAGSFNHMTEQLSQQRDRLVQAERVAAWRELARRLAHELKNPLFPLQITVENLQRSRLAAGGDAQAQDQFEEVFRESTSTLLVEIAQLKTIIARFSDFARMPAPRVERIELASFLPPIVKLFEAQWSAPGGPRFAAAIEVEQSGDAPLEVEADPEQLSRAIRNLILNAMDAMREGGRIEIKAAAAGGAVAIEVADAGEGLTEEECARLFTPYYTTKKHGTGLGLAIVQSVVSDHGGTISVTSQKGEGARFRIELPRVRNSHGTSASR
ncbi:MAG: ATP-binding protein [Bryobacteraceae bacterium]